MGPKVLLLIYFVNKLSWFDAFHLWISTKTWDHDISDVETIFNSLFFRLLVLLYVVFTELSFLSRFTKSSVQDMRINLAISAVFVSKTKDLESNEVYAQICRPLLTLEGNENLRVWHRDSCYNTMRNYQLTENLEVELFTLCIWCDSTILFLQSFGMANCLVLAALHLAVNWYFMFLNNLWLFCFLLLPFLHSYLTHLFVQTAWVLIKRNAEYKPLQFLTFAFVYRIFEKLKSFEPPVTPTYTVSHIVKTTTVFPIFCGITCKNIYRLLC